MEHINTSTPDITLENQEKLLELFPQVATEVVDDEGEVERSIDFDSLRDLLGDVAEGTRERYQFTWPGKRAAKEEARKPINKTLRPCPEKSVDWDTTENLYIEGDNLEALKLLRETYAGKVKMIYIDPPYNTGHNFLYSDSFAHSLEAEQAESGAFDDEGNILDEAFKMNSEANGRFHSDWCSMMYPRLLLARDLLSDDGVIFISIDDNEETNLTKLCDEIFGSSNNIGPIIQNKNNAKNDTLNVQKNHEFILAYRKQIIFDSGNIKSTIVCRQTKEREVFEEEGHYFYLNDPITTRGEGGTLNARPNLGYSVYFNEATGEKRAVSDYDIDLARVSNNEEEVYSTDEELLEQGFVCVRPPRVRGQLGCWTWSLEKFQTHSNEIAVIKTRNSYSVRKRTFVDEKKCTKSANGYVYKEEVKTNSKSILDFSTNEGTKILNDTIGASAIFDNPKNLEMIKYLVDVVDNNQAIILDFFSGSATTAHALMRLNAEDNGSRRYIMVQHTESVAVNSNASKAGYRTICEIGEERIRRAGKKIAEEVEESNKQLKLGEEPKQVPDIGFRVLRIDDSNFNDVSATPNEYEQGVLDLYIDNLKPGRSDLDILFEVLPKFRIPLSAKIEEKTICGKRVYTVEDDQLIACFDNNLTSEAIEEIAKLQPIYAVFRDTCLQDDATAANLEELFKTFSPDTIRRVI